MPTRREWLQKRAGDRESRLWFGTCWTGPSPRQSLRVCSDSLCF
jgi:hypothetical protein